MKEQLTMEVINLMTPHLNNNQIMVLKSSIYMVLQNYDISERKKMPAIYNPNWISSLKRFLDTKEFEGKSHETIKQYKFELEHLLSYLSKNVEDIDDADISNYLLQCKIIRKISNQSLENKRLIYSSFFTWLHTRGSIRANPMRNIPPFKVEKKIKKPFSDEERELLLMSAKHIRDKAMMEFCYSTCVRVSELAAINIADIRFQEKDLIVYGKGAKERIVYINSRAFVYLQMYLRSRTDDNPALFVSLRNPHTRLTKSGIESAIREAGRRAGVTKAHPHRFRRTGATNASNRGMPIEEVATLLGHEKLDTTRRYCTVKQQSVKYHHEKYLSA